jgi:hypothetical protein
MSVPAPREPGHHLRRFLPRPVLATLLALVAAAGCEYPFEPFQESEGAVFSMFGYLNLKADTQWVRVMPVRQNLLLEPEPIDAVVTLQHEASGRTVTLNDSLFSFPDPQLDGVAYAYNFWTTEPIEPGETYLLRAVRSDGAATTATIVMPGDLEIAFLTGPGIGSEGAQLRVRAEHLLFVEVLHAMSTRDGSRSESIAIREGAAFPTDDPAVFGLTVRSDTLERDGLLDARRMEIRLAVGPADWPFHSELPDIEVSLPGLMPSNVEGGLGYVGGVATWIIPFHQCEAVQGRPDGEPFCRSTFSARSASIAGTLLREGCGDAAVLMNVYLTELFADGTSITRSWKSGWDGTYRFEGIEPGAELLLRAGNGGTAVVLPPLAPGESFAVEDIAVPVESC